jgi:hypothetical protein
MMEDGRWWLRMEVDDRFGFSIFDLLSSTVVIVSPTFARRVFEACGNMPDFSTRKLSEGSICGLKYPISMGLPHFQRPCEAGFLASQGQALKLISSTILTNTTTPLCVSSWEEK